MEMRHGGKLIALNIAGLGRDGMGHKSSNRVHHKNGSEKNLPQFSIDHYTAQGCPSSSQPQETR